MIENTNIDERDIFNFVFFTELLSPEKIEFLESNKDKFEQVEFYTKLKSELTKNLSADVRKKISEKIRAYQISKIIKLFPVIDETKKRPSEMPILAAASSVEEPSVSAKTYIDKNKTFLIRLLRVGNKTKIFAFPITRTDTDEIKLTLHPEELNLTIHKDTPVELEGKHEVESISVEVN